MEPLPKGGCSSIHAWAYLPFRLLQTQTRLSDPVRQKRDLFEKPALVFWEFHGKCSCTKVNLVIQEARVSGESLVPVQKDNLVKKKFSINPLIICRATGKSYSHYSTKTTKLAAVNHQKYKFCHFTTASKDHQKVAIVSCGHQIFCVL